MDSIAQSLPHFSSALWADALHGSAGAPGRAAFWIAVSQIVFINILLSGDNAVVIAMACRALPPRQRFWGMAIGVGTAAILLVAFAAVILPLMALPLFRLFGGLLLFYIAVKLLLADERDKEIEAAARLSHVVRVVAVADIIMGLDNIIAVAAVARGHVVLLAIGVAVSIPVVLAGAAVITVLLDRFPVLLWLGAALLGWIAGDLMATDPLVSGYVIAAFGRAIAQRIEIAAAAGGVVLVVAAGAIGRRLR